MAKNLLSQIPTYPWEQLVDIRRTAAVYPEGVVDLSIGSPVDPTPDIAQHALVAAADAPGYPTAAGTPALRQGIASWYARRRNVPGLGEDAVVATIGSKEFIALVPIWMGLGEHDVIVQPVVHYPTYAIGAQMSGAQIVSSDDPEEWPAETKLIWLNSPGNPDGVVHSIEYLQRAVARARALGALIVQDECYAELPWTEPWASSGVPCILDPRVVGNDVSGVVSIYSLSKQSNLAGYRAAFAAGDPAFIQPLINVRKQAGLSLPAPIQAAMVAALSDDAHVSVQRDRYRARRERLLPAVERWGLDVSASEAGLYIWGTAHEDGWETLRRLADLGIIGGPGAFYGEDSQDHIRLSITATDQAIAAAASRLESARAR